MSRRASKGLESIGDQASLAGEGCAESQLEDTGKCLGMEY